MQKSIVKLLNMPILLIHDISHLLSYNHEKDEDYKVMHKREQKILKLLRS